MIIGFDYWRTITRDPKLFRDLAVAILNGRHQLHVITAVGKNRAPKMEIAVRTLGVPYTSLEVLVFNHPSESPQLKLEACKRLGIQLFIDDRLDVCELLSKNDILALNILKGK